MTTPIEKRNHTKFCEFHGEVGHNTDECMHLKKQIEEMLKAGKLSHLIKELKQNRIISIKVNGKNAYELKGTFLDDLHSNAFSGTNGEDADEHIEYFLRIVDPVDLPNVNQDKLRLLVFPISLKMGSDDTELTNENGSDLEDECLSDVDETAEIFKIEDNLLDYETPLCKAFNEFNYLLKIDTDLFIFEIQEIKTYRNIDEFCNGGELPGMVRVGCMTYFQDYKCFENFKELDYDVLVKLEECWWKVNAHEKAPFARCKNYGQGPYANAKTKKDYDPYLDNNRIFEKNYKANNAGDTQYTKKEFHDPSICTIRRFEMVKYSFKDDEEYVAIKEN
ncbi:hypothetical protein Tco_1015453 [Tanacetum coccineum]|uniref:Reverse transcriptase domain-containing protein n=1 Tax=Tanacetum coccineum TaxID=301880 RepID=A0ABQ5FKU6_9ASTR